MKDNRNLLATAIRYALGAGMVAGLTATAAPVVAQDDDTADLGQVQVTGSRILRTEVETANPVTVFDREDLTRTSAANLGELIQRLATENTGSPLTTQTNNGGNGAVTVDLRGFGRTLVLINGRRIVDGGDFQTMPLAMVERVDILKTGASAVYGVDAVAGVVNVITRTNFQGAEFTASYQRPEDFSGGADNRTIGGIFGIANDKGYANVGFERRKQDPVTQGDFDNDPRFFSEPRLVFDAEAFAASGNDPFDPDSTVFLGSSRTPQGAFSLRDGRTLANGCPNSGGVGPNDPDTGFCTPDFGLGSPTNDSFNFNPFNFIQTPFETKNFFAHAGYELHENAEIYFEGRYSARESQQLLAPSPFDTLFDPGFPVNVFNDDGEPVGTVPGIPAENAFNPFGQDVLRVRRRIIEGERRFEQNIDQFQAVIGLRGAIPFAPTWTYDASLNYGERNNSSIDRGQLIGARLEQAMGPSFFDDSGNAVCGTPDNPISGCVPINFFGGPGTITQEMLDFVSVPAVDSVTSDQEIWNVSFAGDLISLPAGPVAAAFGGEFRDESFLTTPDSNKAIDGISGNVFGQNGGSEQVTSFFAEINVPLLRDFPLAKTLEVKAAYRFDDFETDLDPRVGIQPTSEFDNDSFEVGVRWEPMDGLLLRGTWSEVFTSPGVGNLFAPLADNFQQAQDPCSASNFGELSAAEQQACFNQGVPAGGVVGADPQPRTRVGGNPDLGPESGDTYTAGFVFSPTFVPGFTLSLDWWKIELDDALNTIDTGTILQQCLDVGGVGGVCDLIERNNPTNPGEISLVLSNTQNIGSEDGEGLDLGFSYDYNAGNFGLFSVGGQWTHLLERERSNFPGDVTVLEGNFDGDGDSGFAEDKFNGTVTWNFGDFKFDYLAQFVGSYDADLLFFGGSQEVPSQLYHDVQGTWSAPWDMDFTAGITNLTDNNPPFIDAAFNGNIDESNHRVFGRVWTLGLVQRF
ncbi:MAG: TonB-dependent receptor [Wenzhouxiangellaceae bacterium]|nr:TonB-dependent receptor [Wenzhouxiangellaceae bacterium]